MSRKNAFARVGWWSCVDLHVRSGVLRGLVRLFVAVSLVPCVGFTSISRKPADPCKKSTKQWPSILLYTHNNVLLIIIFISQHLPRCLLALGIPIYCLSPWWWPHSTKFPPSRNPDFEIPRPQFHQGTVSALPHHITFRISVHTHSGDFSFHSSS
jgi:hypothetical protein